ncbi:MAG TPA: alpha/beta fold hydrolase [Limnochordales bacterium]|nr:alpha/beta fold hydrolase [Limnochordales bacterium]
MTGVAAVPKFRVGDIHLYYELHGTGPPLLLLAGLGMPATIWYHQVPAFAARHQVILVDNRGAGRSDHPLGDYTVAQMALDTARLLAGLGVGPAHVLGFSLGGLIAQELALTHPARVRSLVLASTHPGGPEYRQATGSQWQHRLQVAGMTREEIYRRAMEWSTSAAFRQANPEEVERFVMVRAALPAPGRGFQGQFRAAMSFDARDRLPQLRRPVLVIHGTADEVVPPRFAEDLARRIPGARLHWIEGAGHLPFLEQPQAFNQAVLDFLVLRAGA